jgi:hypothetical protein
MIIRLIMVILLSGCTTTVAEWECYDESEFRQKIEKICEACNSKG